MNKQLLILCIALFWLRVNGQNGQLNGKYFLLINDSTTISLNTYENNRIQEVTTFEVNERSIFTTDNKHRLAVLDTTTNTILLYDLNTAKRKTLVIPFKIEALCILVDDANIFIGGMKGNTMLVQYSIERDKWFRLRVPRRISSFRKAIDDLVINDSHLIALDNIVMPKYILFYNLNGNKKFRYSHKMLLASNGTYETIIFGRLSENHFGTMSQTMGRGGIRHHIAIYDKLNTNRCFSIMTAGNNDQDFRFIDDYVILKNFVVIASRDMGLGVFEILETCFEKDEEFSGRWNKRFGKDDIRHLGYRGQQIIRLTLIPETNKVIVSIKDANEIIRHEIIEI